MRKEKQIVKKFYDTFGWHKNTDGIYNDTSGAVDLRSVLDSYYHKTHMRVKNFLISRGEYFLDAGSGAIPQPELLEYSSSYKRRVCIDLSERALMEARAKLKEQGLYVLADVANLPFKDGVFDAIVSAHVLYHVPQDEQESAVIELHRTMKCGSSCVIIYVWPTCLLTKIAKLFNARWIIAKISGTRLRKIVKRVLQIFDDEKHEGGSRPPLYLHAHNYQWFQKIVPYDWNVDIRCWRSVDNIFTETLVPNNFWGRLLMKLIFWLETVFPHALAKIGAYPMIIIRKK